MTRHPLYKTLAIKRKERLYALVKEIPRGKVTTYGRLAKRAGIANPRLVGTYLHQNPDPDIIPCHRVVNSVGRLAPKYAFGGLAVQRQLLEQEGIVIHEDRVQGLHLVAFF